MKDFYNYLDSVKFNYQSLSQLRYEEFKLGTGLKDTTDSTGKSISIYPEKPNWSQSELEELKKISSKLDSILTVESKRSLSENESEIKRYLREALLVREFGQDHEIYYRSKLTEDEQMKAAINILVDTNTYSKLLNPKAIKQAEVKK